MMLVDYMDFFGGCLGFILFELLKIYKKIWANKKLIPGDRMFLYTISLLGIAVLSGFVAYYFSSNSFVESVFIGFSFPNAIKTIIERVTVGDVINKKIDVDDVSLSNKYIKKDAFYYRVKNFVKNIFEF